MEPEGPQLAVSKNNSLQGNIQPQHLPKNEREKQKPKNNTTQQSETNKDKTHIVI